LHREAPGAAGPGDHLHLDWCAQQEESSNGGIREPCVHDQETNLTASSAEVNWVFPGVTGGRRLL